MRFSVKIVKLKSLPLLIMHLQVYGVILVYYNVIEGRSQVIFLRVDKNANLWDNKGMKKPMTERAVATAVLKEITQDGAYSGVALRRALAGHAHLERAQKAFVTEIVAGCVRNLFLIDHIIGQFSKTPVARIKPFLLNVLRISVYQLKFMDKVPEFAVCNEAVQMAKQQGFSGLSGYVNGVLRNIARNEVKMPDEMWMRYSVQPWIVEHFTKEIGQDATADLLKSIMTPPTITIAANTLKITTDELIEILKGEGVEVLASKLPDALNLAKTADIAALPSFLQGLYHVMDASAIIAMLCGGVKKDAHIIDLCAAPGGKAFLAAYLAGEGATLLVRDVHEHKIKLLNAGIARLGLKNAKAKLADACIHDPSLIQTADHLIIDAPCSGLGTLKKRPDIKLSKEYDSIQALASLSRKIIENSWQYVKIGGTMQFLTCTIADEENYQQYKWICENLPFKPVDFSEKLPDGFDCKTAKEGYMQILPQDFGSDGFFISTFERIR